MAVDNKKEIKQKVEAFVKQQRDYSPNEEIKIVCQEGEMYFILYGENLQSGVAGFGKTADAAFDDFKENWNKYMI